ncbi:MAG: hypothetical protein EA377_02730 [Phycisphaerales bacterium]|nr:MAG: hypothetical protein EA377_02730 [Phycisphaerales bacterium]
MCLEGRLVALAEDDMAKYVLRMAENTATNKILAECRRQHTLQRLKRELPDLHDEIVAEPNQSVIESRLPKLTEGDREILELRLRGLSHVQIANALKVPLTTERTRWQRMRARVKAFMAPAAHSEERRIPQSTNRNSS